MTFYYEPHDGRHHRNMYFPSSAPDRSTLRTGRHQTFMPPWTTSWLSTQPAVESPARMSSTLASHEKAIIEDALRGTSGRVVGPLGSRARLGIPYSTLESMIRTLKINSHASAKTFLKAVLSRISPLSRFRRAASSTEPVR